MTTLIVYLYNSRYSKQKIGFEPNTGVTKKDFNFFLTSCFLLKLFYPTDQLLSFL